MRERITTNRKSTRGRRIYFQHIPTNTSVEILDEDKKFVGYKTVQGRTVKHIQESPNKIKIAEKLLEQMHYKYKQPKGNEKTLAKKEEKRREVLVWNSIMKGTYRGKLKEEFKYVPDK